MPMMNSLAAAAIVLLGDDVEARGFLLVTQHARLALGKMTIGEEVVLEPDDLLLLVAELAALGPGDRAVAAAVLNALGLVGEALVDRLGRVRGSGERARHHEAGGKSEGGDLHCRSPLRDRAAPGVSLQVNSMSGECDSRFEPTLNGVFIFRSCWRRRVQGGELA